MAIIKAARGSQGYDYQVQSQRHFFCACVYTCVQVHVNVHICGHIPLHTNVEG